MLESDERPVSQADEFLHLCLDPGLEDGVLGGNAVDGDWGDVGVAQVGLVEHVSIVVETEEVAHGVCFFGCEEVVKVAAAGGGVDPLLHGTGGCVAVVVDAGCPAGVDLHAIETVGGGHGEVGPVHVLLVEEGVTGVVADTVGDAILPPGAKSVAIVKTSDGWGNDAVGGEVCGLVNPDLLQPSLVEADLLVDIGVGGVVLLLVGEGVGDRAEAVQILGGGPPNEERVHLGAGGRPVVVGRSSGPQVGTRTQGLLELEGSVRGRVILDGATIAGNGAGVGVRRLLDVAVTIVADFREIDAARIHLGKDGRNPVLDALHILSADTEGGATGGVDVGLQEHVIDLGIQVDATVSGEHTAGNPGNPGVLKIVRGGTPGSVKRDEECHLLTTVKIVDDSSNSVTGGDRVGSKRSNLLGGSGVANCSRVVPQALSADTSASLETRRGEVADIGERNFLLNTRSTATTAHGSSTKVRTGIDVVLNHADAILELVGVELVPLVRSQGTLVALGSVIVANLGRNDDTTEVTSSAGVKSGEIDTSLGNNQSSERNTVGIETGRSNSGRSSVPGNHQDIV